MKSDDEIPLDQKRYTHRYHALRGNIFVGSTKHPRARGRPDPLNCRNFANSKAAFPECQLERKSVGAADTHKGVRCGGRRQQEDKAGPEPPTTIDGVCSHGEKN